jgi:hypothetical protein
MASPARKIETLYGGVPVAYPRKYPHRRYLRALPAKRPGKVTRSPDFLHDKVRRSADFLQGCKLLSHILKGLSVLVIATCNNFVEKSAKKSAERV